MKHGDPVQVGDHDRDPHADGSEIDRHADADETETNNPYTESLPDRQASYEIMKVRKRSTIGSVIGTMVSHLANLVRERAELHDMDSEVRKGDNIGFSFTDRQESGDIRFHVNCDFRFAPDYIKLDVSGADQNHNFSNTVRVFMSDKLNKVARRIVRSIPGY